MTIFNACNNRGSGVAAASFYNTTTASISLAAGTITQVSLNNMLDATANASEYFQISNGAVKLLKKGVYIIEGSAYINLSTATARAGIYITDGADTEIHSYYPYNGGSGTKISGMCVRNFAAGNTIKLKARASVATTVLGNHETTRLNIVYLGAY